MKTTLKTIADATGYSQSTVSRVLNGSSSYTEETQSAIIAAARKLNYSGLSTAVLKQSKSYLNIVLLTDFHEGEFYASYFSGFVKACASRSIRLSLISIHDSIEMIKEIIGQASDNYYDAAILFAPKLTRDDYLQVLNFLPEGFPIVSNALIEMPVLQTITFDGYSGGHIAASYFHEKGYKNLGIVKGPSQKAESRFRYNGYKDYINQQNDLNLVFESPGDFNFEAGVLAFKQYMHAEIKPDAIFISNDLMCHGFLETARHHGIAVPQTVALLGYDDLPMCIHSNPPISSVKTDFTKLAEASLIALNQRIQNPEHNQGLLSQIPVSICERETV